MMRIWKFLGILLLVGVLATSVAFLPGCEKDAGDTMEDAADDVEDAVDDAGDAIDDALDDAGDAVDDATDDR